MPIYEIQVKYPPSVFWNNATGSKVITEAEQNDAISEFNRALTNGRESLKMWFWESNLSVSEWAFGGILEVNTDGVIDTTRSPESRLIDLADRLDAFLVGRFHITARHSGRFFGEITIRERRRGEAIIIDVTIDELFGRA
jgi:hypothetical protein